MLKYIKHHLDTMDNVEVYPIISLVLFFAVFITMLVHVLRLPKDNIEEISNIPLQEDENINEYE